MTTETAIEINTSLQEPPMYNVIYVNDNETSIQFVIGSLVQHFDYNEETAARIAKDIHLGGSAVAATLPFQLAEQKGIDIVVSARKKGYPLQIKIDKEAP